MDIQLNPGKTRSFEMEALAEKWNLNTQLSKKEQKGLAVIIGHSGKSMVFEAYLQTNQEMAMKYLKFISDNPDARYVKWDVRRQKFVSAN